MPLYSIVAVPARTGLSPRLRGREISRRNSEGGRRNDAQADFRLPLFMIPPSAVMPTSRPIPTRASADRRPRVGRLLGGIPSLGVAGGRHVRCRRTRAERGASRGDGMNIFSVARRRVTIGTFSRRGRRAADRLSRVGRGAIGCRHGPFFVYKQSTGACGDCHGQRQPQLSAAAFAAGFGASEFAAGAGLDSFSSVNFHDVSLYCLSPFNQGWAQTTASAVFTLSAALT